MLGLSFCSNFWVTLVHRVSKSLLTVFLNSFCTPFLINKFECKLLITNYLTTLSTYYPFCSCHSAFFFSSSILAEKRSFGSGAGIPRFKKVKKGFVRGERDKRDTKEGL